MFLASVLAKSTESAADKREEVHSLLMHRMETQRNRDTETQRHRDAQTQKHGDTETQKHTGTGTQRSRDTKDTETMRL